MENNYKRGIRPSRLEFWQFIRARDLRSDHMKHRETTLAVLVEAISVVIRLDAIRRAFGSLQTFEAVVPNGTYCYDEEIARVGFMAEVDARAFAENLQGRGLTFSTEDPSSDIVLVDQVRGLWSSCDWLDVVKVEIGHGCQVQAALLRGSLSDQLSCPGGWSFERSLSFKYGYAVPHEQNGLRFLGHRNGQDVFWNELTNEEVFVGRSPAVLHSLEFGGPTRQAG